MARRVFIIARARRGAAGHGELTGRCVAPGVTQHLCEAACVRTEVVSVCVCPSLAKELGGGIVQGGGGVGGCVVLKEGRARSERRRKEREGRGEKGRH